MWIGLVAAISRGRQFLLPSNFDVIVFIAHLVLICQHSNDIQASALMSVHYYSSSEMRCLEAYILEELC